MKKAYLEALHVLLQLALATEPGNHESEVTAHPVEFVFGHKSGLTGLLLVRLLLKRTYPHVYHCELVIDLFLELRELFFEEPVKVFFGLAVLFGDSLDYFNLALYYLLPVYFCIELRAQ